MGDRVQMEQSSNGRQNQIDDAKTIPDSTMISDSATELFLKSVGIERVDPRVIRMISLATQKHISDIINYAMTSALMNGLGRSKKGNEDTKYTLTEKLLDEVLKLFGHENICSRITLHKPLTAIQERYDQKTIEKVQKNLKQDETQEFAIQLGDYPPTIPDSAIQEQYDQNTIEKSQKNLEQDETQEFGIQLDDYPSMIPDSVTMHFLKSAGVEGADPRVIRMISLAAQKHLSDITYSAMSNHRIFGQNKKGAKDTEYSLNKELLEEVLKNYEFRSRVALHKPPTLNCQLHQNTVDASPKGKSNEEAIRMADFCWQLSRRVHYFILPTGMWRRIRVDQWILASMGRNS